EQLRAVPGRVLDDFERMKAGCLLQFELARDAESVHRIDVPGIIARRDEAAFVRELADGVAPDPVLPRPARLLRTRPAEEVRPVILERRFEVLLERWMEVVAEPRLIFRALQIAARFVDREGRVPRDVMLHHAVDDAVEL